MTATTKQEKQSHQKTNKNTQKKISFFEGDFILVDMPAAEGSVDAAEHYPFQHKFIYVIRCYL